MYFKNLSKVKITIDKWECLKLELTCSRTEHGLVVTGHRTWSFDWHANYGSSSHLVQNETRFHARLQKQQLQTTIDPQACLIQFSLMQVTNTKTNMENFRRIWFDYHEGLDWDVTCRRTVQSASVGDITRHWLVGCDTKQRFSGSFNRQHHRHWQGYPTEIQQGNRYTRPVSFKHRQRGVPSTNTEVYLEGTPSKEYTEEYQTRKDRGLYPTLPAIPSSFTDTEVFPLDRRVPSKENFVYSLNDTKTEAYPVETDSNVPWRYRRYRGTHRHALGKNIGLSTAL